MMAKFYVVCMQKKKKSKVRYCLVRWKLNY